MSEEERERLKRQFRLKRAKTFRWLPLIEIDNGTIWVNWLWWRAYSYV